MGRIVPTLYHLTMWEWQGFEGGTLGEATTTKQSKNAEEDETMRIAVILIALVLAGCGPTVAGNDLGGSVEGGGYTTNVDAFNAAETHCAKYGRKARVTQSAPQTAYSVSSMTFDCV
jgi:hypothetical protein